MTAVSTIAVCLAPEDDAGTHFPKGSGIRAGILASAEKAATRNLLPLVDQIDVPELEELFLIPANNSELEENEKRTERNQKKLQALLDKLVSLPRSTILILFWNDMYGWAFGQALLQREQEGRVTIFLNQPWVRPRCNAFGQEGNFLRYNPEFRFPYGDDSQSYPDEADESFSLEFADWQQPDPNKKPVIFAPGPGALEFHGYFSIEEYVEETAQFYGLDDYILSVHPKFYDSLPDHLKARFMKGADALANASIVYTLQSGAAFDAWKLGIPVIANSQHHPVGAIMDDLGLLTVEQARTIDRSTAVKQIAPFDIPANDDGIGTVINEAIDKLERQAA